MCVCTCVCPCVFMCACVCVCMCTRVWGCTWRSEGSSGHLVLTYLLGLALGSSRLTSKCSTLNHPPATQSPTTLPTLSTPPVDKSPSSTTKRSTSPAAIKMSGVQFGALGTDIWGSGTPNHQPLGLVSSCAHHQFGNIGGQTPIKRSSSG